MSEDTTTSYTIPELIPEIIYDSNKKYPDKVIRKFLDVSNELEGCGYRLEIVDGPGTGLFAYCLTVREKKDNGEWTRVAMPTEPGDTSQNARSISNTNSKQKEWMNADVLHELLMQQGFIPGTFWWQWYKSFAA